MRKIYLVQFNDKAANAKDALERMDAFEINPFGYVVKFEGSDEELIEELKSFKKGELIIVSFGVTNLLWFDDDERFSKWLRKK